MRSEQTMAVPYYDNLPGWGSPPDEATLRRSEAILGLIPKGVRSVLDAGCGDGKVSNAVVDKGLRVVGVDISGKALTHFRGHAVVADLGHLPFLDHTFDLVICSEVLEHLPRDIFYRAKDEIGRTARDFVIVSTPNREYLPASSVRCGRCGHVYHRAWHLRTFDRASHRALLAGFALVKTVEIETWQFYPLEVTLRHKLIGIGPAPPDRTCPVCGFRGPIAQGPAQADRLSLPALLGLLRLLRLKPLVLHCLRSRLFRRRCTRWLASLYRRSPDQ